jgi:DNA-directed RNA polymerase alpha subunit
MKQSDLTSTSSFSGRAPNRSTRNRRILPIDGTVFPVKKVNYTIEQDSFGKEIVFFEVWTNGGLHPRDALFQSIEKVIKLFQTFQE